jgi:pimeloyl-ACP methyl ester carboxylesterase
MEGRCMSELEIEDRLVDVDGRRVEIRISGGGAPPVVCLSSAGGAHDQWAEFVPLVQPVTTCITYGRPGLGRSDPLPAEIATIRRGGRWAAEHLRAVLQAADVAPPYLFATGSIGAWLGDQFAAQWPDEVAGLVLIDPTQWTPIPRIERDDLLPDGGPGCIQFSWEQSFAELAEARPTIRGRLVVLSAAVGRWLRNTPAAWHEPLTLTEVDQIWQEKQLQWVERLAAVRVIADTAGHHVHLEQPELAAHVVRAVVAAAREDRAVQLDPAAVAAAGGTLV